LFHSVAGAYWADRVLRWRSSTVSDLTDLMLLALLLALASALTPTPETPVFITPPGNYTDYAHIQVYVPAPYDNDDIYYGLYTANPALMTRLVPRYYDLLPPASTLTQNLLFSIYAQRPGFGPSAVVSGNFTLLLNLNVPPPTVSIVQSGGATTVTMTQGDPTIFTTTRYELDTGLTAGYSSPAYTDPIVITTPGPHTLSVVDTKEFSRVSNISSVVTRTFTVAQTAPPIITPSDGLYLSNSLLASVACGNAGCSLFYTLDGSDPVVVFSNAAASPSNTATVPYTAGIQLAPGIRKLGAVATFGGFASAVVSSNFQITGLLAPPSFSPPSGTQLASPASVTIASRDGANIWIVVRPRDDTRPAPATLPSAEWTLLLQPNLTLAADSTVYVALDKLNYVPAVNVSSAAYTLAVQPGVLVVGPGFNLLWLLMLLAILPAIGLVVAAYLYEAKQRREALENSIFREHGFEFAPQDQ
jgi:hypothetical protein